jgi:hypothetical protein
VDQPVTAVELIGMLTGYLLAAFVAALFAVVCYANARKGRRIDVQDTEIKRLNRVVGMVCRERAAAEARETAANERGHRWYEIAQHEITNRRRRRGCPRLHAYEQETDS